jgi:ubiquinone/menaquinone biosynthesis C-methylase UbiE
MNFSKEKVKEYWEKGACGSAYASSEKFSQPYYEEIEEARYRLEPEIFSFAQFSRAYGKNVLEVGVGAGTDFLQWARSGARISGIDLTEEAITNTRNRLKIYGFEAEYLQVADCESLPFNDGEFDVVYSWGVIHHTPDMTRALSEIVRVCKPGGICKIMIYHRHSIVGYYHWFTRAFLKGKPHKSIDWCIANHMESVGTQCYSRKQVHQILQGLNIKEVTIKTPLTAHDVSSSFRILTYLKKTVAYFLGHQNCGWYMMISFRKNPLNS